MMEIGAPFDCQECGKAVEAQEFHDSIECVRWRVGFGNLKQADVESLLDYIDQLEPERRGLQR